MVIRSPTFDPWQTEDNTEMFQEPVIAIVLKSGDASGLRLCHKTGCHGGGGVRVIAEANGALEGDPVAKFRVEPGYQIQDTWRWFQHGHG